MKISAPTLRALLQIAETEGADAAEAVAAEFHAADSDAAAALEHDDSEWADRLNGYGQPDSIIRNDAGEYLGFM